MCIRDRRYTLGDDAVAESESSWWSDNNKVRRFTALALVLNHKLFKLSSRRKHCQKSAHMQFVVYSAFLACPRPAALLDKHVYTDNDSVAVAKYLPSVATPTAKCRVWLYPLSRLANRTTV